MRKHIIPVLILATPFSVAHASFEKSISWSGRYSGIAGITAGNVEGAQSLFFNPAGAAGKQGLEIDLNGSPTWVTYKGPIVPNSATDLTTGPQLTSTTATAPYAGFHATYGITPQWAVGAGLGVVGGSRAKFSSVDFSALAPTFTLKPDIKNELTFTEWDIGSAYEVMPGLKIGATWRISRFTGDAAVASVLPASTFSNAYGATSSLYAAQISDISATRYNGFRFGAQYAPSKDWGIGASWRTTVDFVGKGTSKGQLDPSATSAFNTTGDPVDLTGGDATLAVSLPQQFQLGGYYDLAPQKIAFFGQVDWTQYHRDQNLIVEGAPNPGQVLPGQATQTTLSTPLNYNNIWTFRVGGEYTGIESWALRAGYFHSTQGTPNTYAKANAIAPGAGNGFQVGGGKQINDWIRADGAFEYAWATGQGESPALTGDYSTSAIAAHLGVSMTF